MSPDQCLDGSFRKSNSVISAHSISGASASSKSVPSSRRVFKGLKDHGKKLGDFEMFAQNLEEWVLENLYTDPSNAEEIFSSPFMIDELRKLDVALEGILFQQLFRMPCSPYVSDDLKEDEYLAVEDFLHAIANGLWRTFWHKGGPLPFFLSCPRNPGSKFYTLEKAISKGRLRELCGFALMSRLGSDPQVRWDQVVGFVLFKPDILSGNELKFSSRVICEALFYGFHLLVSRCLNKTSTLDGNYVFILVLDSRYGGVVRFGGDLRKLDLNSSNPYHSVVEWIKNYAEVRVSPVDMIWNKLGNPNWGDLGTLQLLLATFYSIAQWHGPPRKSIASLASDHSLRLQKRWMECRPVEKENAFLPLQLASYQQGEIVEVDQADSSVLRKKGSRLKLKRGEILQLDDQQRGQKTFQIQESVIGGNYFLYSAVSLDYPMNLLALYVGAHPSRLEPSWEDMSLWYQVQRQTKVLNVLKQQGSSNKYLPEIVASGRVLHSGPCRKQSQGGRCDHPWCGTPVLVTSPVGEPLWCMVARDGSFSSEEAVRCCRDCMAALRIASMANVQHGDICPENIIRVVDLQGARYVPISWGRAVLEERDSPAINLQFSSSHALEHGKLCPSSDAESLVYLLLFVCGGGGSMQQQQDSIESALQWREGMWAKRLIQQQLGEVSAILKAFADYVDSLCGTPYPVDYDIWLKRLSKAVDGSADRGKMVEEVGLALGLDDVGVSSATSTSGGGS
ncbi:Protein kinase-like domain containing protein [Parasponia andersonii]|uniref:Protein kinase-like domain containing protein n=1 Tax=Parasponia andersonii TaxID=3476 RepID=A0A2P5AGE2_PARAD|nr:Protein kinase-like domain containing protein [Parasponia andersonii]